MMPVSAAAIEAAHRIWAESAHGADTPAETLAAAERVWADHATGLARWIGRAGYHSLVNRAIEQARPAHPWLASLRFEEGRLHGLTAAAPGHTAAETANGMIALIAMVVHVLGRIAGEDLAIRLVEQTWRADTAAAPVSRSPGVGTTKGTQHD